MKQVASHFGGTRNGLVMSWPGHITDQGGLRSQFHHVIDIAPTILEVAGIPEPREVNGVPQKPIEGISMAYTFGDEAARAGESPSTSRCSATARSTTTAGWQGVCTADCRGCPVAHRRHRQPARCGGGMPPMAS